LALGDHGVGIIDSAPSDRRFRRQFDRDRLAGQEDVARMIRRRGRNAPRDALGIVPGVPWRFLRPGPRRKSGEDHAKAKKQNSSTFHIPPSSNKMYALA
jgi:hypothetical protein